MMRQQTSLLKWSISKKSTATSDSQNKNGNKCWIHPPEALQRGHIAYLVKFLGNTEVDQPKGIDVVKEGIRKMKFTEHLKRAEGAKSPKVELTISIDGVAIEEPKSKKILHQYPLHRISYCADDKADKKFFSFIAKEPEAERHVCYVFVSDKLAEEITLTIGQAFDLAYRRFLETSGRDLEMRRQLIVLQKRVQELQKENTELKAKVTDYESKNGTNKNLRKKSESSSSGLSDLSNSSLMVPPPLQPPPVARTVPRSQSLAQNVSLLDAEITDNDVMKPTVGRKLENLSLEDLDDFNPRAHDAYGSASTNGLHKAVINGSGATNGHTNAVTTTSSITTNGHSNNNGTTCSDAKDIFGSEPFSAKQQQQQQQMQLQHQHQQQLNGTVSSSSDPFGMNSFEPKDYEQVIGAIDKKLAEMRDGFSRGLSFGNDEFSIESLDPLANGRP